MSDGGTPAASRDDASPPHSTRVKICGHTTAADVAASVAAGADAVGVIADVSVDTHREVAVDEAADLLATVPPLATGVLVTMPEDVARAVELVGRTSPDAIQVHGTLTPAEVAELRERVHVDVIAAVDAADAAVDAAEAADEPPAGDESAEDDAELTEDDAELTEDDGSAGTNDELAAYAEAADALLVDTPAADGGGGTGETHDWAATRDATADLDVPVVLAGGLDPETVADAIETVRPFAVDVASGVERVEAGESETSENASDERRRARTDHEAVATFVRNARAANGSDAASEVPPR